MSETTEFTSNEQTSNLGVCPDCNGPFNGEFMHKPERCKRQVMEWLSSIASKLDEEDASKVLLAGHTINRVAAERDRLWAALDRANSEAHGCGHSASLDFHRLAILSIREILNGALSGDAGALASQPHETEDLVCHVCGHVAPTPVEPGDFRTLAECSSKAAELKRRLDAGDFDLAMGRELYEALEFTHRTVQSLHRGRIQASIDRLGQLSESMRQEKASDSGKGSDM